MSPFRSPDCPGEIPSNFDWPEGTYLQGGTKGLVIVREDKPSYTTAFVEAFIPDNAPNTGFYRGEGATVEEADRNVIAKYVAACACVEHNFETRGYTNGLGFCKLCSYACSNVFTAEQLGQFCVVCNEPVFSEGKRLTPDNKEGIEHVLMCGPHSSEAETELKQFLLGLDERTSYQERTLNSLLFWERISEEEGQDNGFGVGNV